MDRLQKKWDVCLLTENRYLHRQPDNPYLSNIFLEDDLLTAALESRGLRIIRASWEDPSFSWASVRYVLFRTPWNYFERFPEFLFWLDQTARQTRFLNSEKLIRWNLNKAYLWELAAKGIPVLPGFFFGPGSSFNMTELLQQSEWKDVVMKPAVSGAARHTHRLQPNSIPQKEKLFMDLLKTEPMLLQEFQSSVIENGEVSLIMLGGEFSHAVRKKAKPGDFRVQDDFGGTLHPYTPEESEIRLAERALARCPEQPLYARVDLIFNQRLQPMLTELELIEPELWFRREPEAAGRMADLVLKSLDEKAIN